MQFAKSAILLSALAAVVAAGDTQTITSADQDNSKSTTYQSGAAGIASCRRGNLDAMDRRWTISTAGGGAINNQQGLLGVCNVGERREEHADARDVSEGVRTLGVLQARGGDKMDVLSADQDNSSSQTFQTGAAGIKSCSHGAIARGLEARWAITTGSAPINNQQGVVGACNVGARDEAALRHLGVMTRRFAARGLSAEHQERAVEYLRREAQDLDLLA